MTTTIERIGSFVQAGQAAQDVVDRAIERAELVRLLRDRRDALQDLRDRRAPLEQIEDAQLRLGFTELSLDDFDHEGRAVR